LGDVLRLQIPLTGAGEDTLVTSCIQSKIETLDGELIESPHLDIVMPTKPNLPAYLNLVSQKVMVEPAIKLSVAMTCGGLVKREYSLLLDLPNYSPPVPVPSQAITQTDTQITPIVTETNNPAPATRRPRAPHTPGVPRHVASSSSAKTPIAPEARAQIAPVEKAPTKQSKHAAVGKDVLHVTSEENLPDMDLKLTESLTESAQPTTNQPATDQDRQRIAENKLAQAQFAAILRGENPALTAQNELNKLEQKVQSLENELNKINEANLQKQQEDKTFSPLLIGLIATLTALFLALIALVVIAVRRSRDKNKTWWDQSAEQKQNVADIVDYLQTTAESGHLDPNPITTTRDTVTKEISGVKEEVQQQPINREEPAPKFKRMGLPALEDTNSSTFNFFANRGQSIHIEEISDITQEAEFWMSVNDPHRAIEILEPASRDENPTTPVTWLYLLDLYRLVGDEDNYRDLRHRFKLKFNAKIPNFHEEIVAVRSFEDFPHLISNTCALWQTDDIHGYLESMLVDDREGERVGFDLPVYRDILFLLAICNELKRIKYSPAAKEAVPEIGQNIEDKLPALEDPIEVNEEQPESHDFSNSLNFDVLEFRTGDKDKL